MGYSFLQLAPVDFSEELNMQVSSVNGEAIVNLEVKKICIHSGGRAPAHNSLKYLAISSIANLLKLFKKKLDFLKTLC